MRGGVKGYLDFFQTKKHIFLFVLGKPIVLRILQLCRMFCTVFIVGRVYSWEKYVSRRRQTVLCWLFFIYCLQCLLSAECIHGKSMYLGADRQCCGVGSNARLCFMENGKWEIVGKHKEKTDGSVSCRWEERGIKTSLVRSGEPIFTSCEQVKYWQFSSICDKLFGKETKETRQQLLEKNQRCKVQAW